MSKPLISVIVPAYQVEKYIEQCLESLCNQTYENFEVLLVFSPSEDKTEEIALSYEKKDNRIRCFRSDGKGVSDSRNVALEHAAGEYISFVDSDDWVEETYLEKLYQGIQGHDISVCGFDRVKGKNVKPEQKAQDYLYNKTELLEHILCDNTIGGYLWNKLFRAEIIKEQGIRFDSELIIGEDMLFLTDFVKKTEGGYYSNEILYHYRINEYSALQKMYTTGVFDKKKLSNLQAAEKIQNSLSEGNFRMRQAASCRVGRTAMWTLFNMLKCDYRGPEILWNIKKYLRPNLKAYCKNKNTKTLEKLSAVLISIWPRGFVALARLGLKLMPKRQLRKYVM